MSGEGYQFGKDYLVDYYALLGVERTATAGEITKAYRSKQMQYHPDRFQGLAPELLREAAAQSNLVNEAYATLENAEKKSAYDRALAEWKKPLSRRGEVILDLEDSHFSFPSLLENLNEDPATREEEADKLALQFSGFEKATYAFFRKQAESPSGISSELKGAYLEQLERREIYLSLREGFIWDSMGQKNHSLLPRLEYREQVQESLKGVREEALHNIEREVLLLAVGERTLLPAPESEGKDIDAGKLLSHYTARLDEHFARQTALLEPIAAEREQILEARFDTATRIDYHPDTSVYTPKLVVEVKKDGMSSVWMAFKFTGTKVAGHSPDGIEKVAQPEVAKEWMDRGYTIISFEPIQGIDFRNQLERILSLHAEKLSEAKQE